MRLRTGVALVAAIGLTAGLGAGSALALNDGQPPKWSGGPIPGNGALVCHAKNMGGSGVVVFHDNGNITGGGSGGFCLGE